MAEWQVEIPNDFLKELLQTDSEQLCMDMLNEAAPLLEESMKKEVSSAIRHKDRSTGELIDSISARKATKCVNGAFLVFVGPKGYSRNYYVARNGHNVKTHRKYKMSNAFKLMIIEYGLHNQPAIPTIQRATNAVESKALQLMQDFYDKKVGG